MKSNVTTIDSNNNNNSHPRHHHHQWKKRIAKQQQLVSLSLSKKAQIISMSTADRNVNQENISLSSQQQQIPMKNPLSWRKRWSKWFSACSSERSIHMQTNSRTISTEVSCYLFVFRTLLPSTPVKYK
ncbi:unnamed protein product [Adineta ricciae]|uniref:Uncharacterized protein n=1 Tax=Adineta ricciae TaxID=249248 RepID=A0A814Y0N7_ADIRI|nr:unnamed protein product [Adineta ricciae]